MARTAKKVAARARRPTKKVVARKVTARSDAGSLFEPAEFPAGYKIIRGVSAADLANATALAMREGWRPTGGVCHVTADPLTLAMSAQDGKPPHPYWQAVVR